MDRPCHQVAGVDRDASIGVPLEELVFLRQPAVELGETNGDLCRRRAVRLQNLEPTHVRHRVSGCEDLERIRSESGSGSLEPECTGRPGEVPGRPPRPGRVRLNRDEWWGGRVADHAGGTTARQEGDQGEKDGASGHGAFG